MIDSETPYLFHSAQKSFSSQKSIIDITNMYAFSQMSNCLPYLKVRHLDKISTTSLAISIFVKDTIYASEGSDNTHE